MIARLGGWPAPVLVAGALVLAGVGAAVTTAAGVPSVLGALLVIATTWLSLSLAKAEPRRVMLISALLAVPALSVVSQRGWVLVVGFACGALAGVLLRAWLDSRSASTEPWPTWVGVVVLGGLGLGVVSYAVYAAVTVRSVDDLIELGGPAFATTLAGVMVAVVVLLTRLGLALGTLRWAPRTAARMRRVASSVRDERALALAERSSGASDESLTRASDHLEMAILLLDSGPELEAVQEVERLRALAQAEWTAGAPLTREVDALRDLERRGAGLRRGVDRELHRRPPR